MEIKDRPKIEIEEMLIDYIKSIEQLGSHRNRENKILVDIGLAEPSFYR
jgi:hypothetical protein